VAHELKIGLAVSGGADSTALLVLMTELAAAHGFRPVVLHVDHGLRKSAKGDAAYVKALAAERHLPCHALSTRVRRRKGESLEMAARRVRLAFFEKMTKTLGLDAIATGHQSDDVAETFILRLKRASGADGLAGLKPVSRVGGITFIRPLLNVRHADLCVFLARRGIAWREDETNADVSIPRNLVRHEILPYLAKAFDPKIVEHLCKSAAILRGDSQGVTPLRRRHQARDWDGIGTPMVTPAERRDPLGRRRDPLGCLKMPQYELEISADLGFRRESCVIGELPARAWFSRAALAGRTLEVRPWRAGDRIAPTGMGGRTRKLQDVYVTAKTPPAVRRSLPVLADAETGEILWVPGYRVAESVKVPSADAPSWRFELIPEF